MGHERALQDRRWGARKQGGVGCELRVLRVNLGDPDVRGDRGRSTHREQAFPHPFQASSDERAREGGTQWPRSVGKVQATHPLRCPFLVACAWGETGWGRGGGLHVVDRIPRDGKLICQGEVSEDRGRG